MFLVKIQLLLLFTLSIVSCENLTETKSLKPVVDYTKTKNKATEALTFCEKNNYNTEICILIDMSLHSGKNRFFVWNFKADSIQNSFLVSHGCGDKPWSMGFTKNNPKFSNVSGSHLSSLGKYKIGKRGYSNWGININYLMHGLESSNNNALSRQIVFHSWDKISDSEIYPRGTPEGWGCPAVSNNSMKIIDQKLHNSSKPVLMWIYKD